MLKKVLLPLLVLAVLAGVGFYLFERHERAGIAEAASVPCGDEAKPTTASALPYGIPLSQDETVLRVAKQGATVVAFASLPGGRDDIVGKRDAVLVDLAKVGYEVVETDQEPGYEAEAQVEGPHTGTLRVKPLCDGLLEVRYKIEE